MAKEPARRYQTARELADDLRRWLGDEPIRARPAGRAERLWRWCRRNPGVAALTAAVAALLLAATGTAVWAAFQANARARAEADARNELAFNLYLRNIPRAQEEARLGNWGEMEVLLDEVVQGLPGAPARLGVRLPPPATRLSPARRDGRVEPRHERQPGPVVQPRRPAPGRARPGRDRYRLGPGHGPGVVNSPGHTGQVLCVQFSPDGQLLASAGRDGTVSFWDATTGEKHRTLEKGHAGEIGGMTFSPNGRLLATVGSDEAVRLWDVDTGAKYAEFRTVYKTQARMLRRAAFSPDGRLFACGGEGNAAKVWNVATREQVHSLEGHSDLVYSRGFQPARRSARLDELGRDDEGLGFNSGRPGAVHIERPCQRGVGRGVQPRRPCPGGRRGGARTRP